MKNEVLAEHLRFFKETEEGQEELSEVDARSVARGEIRGEIREGGGKRIRERRTFHGH